MADVIPQRMSAQVEGDFVVFLIGMRINKPWKLHKWLPVVPRDAQKCSKSSTGDLNRDFWARYSGRK
jgi:hypothetical protein